MVDDTVHLTTRQVQVLTLVAAGKTDNEIAMQLHLSTSTVNYHVEQIRERLQARSRAQAVALALQRGIISPPPQSAEADL